MLGNFYLYYHYYHDVFLYIGNIDFWFHIASPSWKKDSIIICGITPDLNPLHQFFSSEKGA